MHWQEFLSRFDFEWEYIKGKANVADPLSRIPTLMTALTQHEMMYAPDLATSNHDLLESLKSGYDKDPWFKIQTHVSSLTFENGFWIRGKLIVVPDANDLRKQIIFHHHDMPFAGHFGKEKTAQLIRQSYWWPSMSKDSEEYVRTCPSCQRNKVQPLKPAGLLQPLPIPEFRWERVSVELITHLLMTMQGHTAIVVYVDALSKMVHFAPAWDDMRSEEFAHPKRSLL